MAVTSAGTPAAGGSITTTRRPPARCSTTPRSAAAALAAAGYVRINGIRIDAPGRMVRPGDVITVALDHAVRVLKVRGFTERRGSANCGQELYEELS